MSGEVRGWWKVAVVLLYGCLVVIKLVLAPFGWVSIGSRQDISVFVVHVIGITVKDVVSAGGWTWGWWACFHWWKGAFFLFLACVSHSDPRGLL